MKTIPESPANPVQINDDVDAHNYGLTKREHFAALALEGLSRNVMLSDVDSVAKTQVKIVARDSVMLADALIEQLNLQNNKENLKAI